MGLAPLVQRKWVVRQLGLDDIAWGRLGRQMTPEGAGRAEGSGVRRSLVHRE